VHGQNIKIRDWRRDDDEPQKIYDYLLQREQYERKAVKFFFDPEGSLDLDVSSEWTLEESYSRDDNGCFLVAMKENSENGDDEKVVGTLGMISGTEISYQSSGSSFAKPEITAAFRRVCASAVEYDEDNTASKSQAKNSSAMKTLESLISKGEQRALKSGATTLIGLAYPELVMTNDGNNDKHDERENIFKPTVKLLESLGYQPSEQQLSGVATIQYEKKLSNKLDNNLERAGSVQGAEWIIPAASVVAFLSFGFLVFNLYSNVFGIEQLWGSIDNGGIGTSLSTQNLEELIQNEKLGRSGLDDGISSTVTRQWQDLSAEELREEQALMKVIQGQSIRSK